jgi:TatD DNase family protein
MLIDTHCHIHDPAMFANVATSRHLPTPLTPDEYLAAAAKNGVTEVICIGTGAKDSQAAVAFAAAHPHVYATVGIHPEELAHQQLSALLAALETWPVGLPAFRKAKPDAETAPQEEQIVAVGEIGLDYHYPELPKDHQIRLFEAQLQLAAEADLPVVLHIREAFDDAYAVIAHFPGLRGVLHSFSDYLSALDKGLSMGFYIGVNGIATFTKDPDQQKAFTYIPLNRLLLETDAPFLTPKPFRGKINQPAYVRAIGEWVAATRNLNLEAVAQTTTRNAHALFNLGD